MYKIKMCVCYSKYVGYKSAGQDKSMNSLQDFKYLHKSLKSVTQLSCRWLIHTKNVLQSSPTFQHVLVNQTCNIENTFNSKHIFCVFWVIDQWNLRYLKYKGIMKLTLILFVTFLTHGYILYFRWELNSIHEFGHAEGSINLLQDELICQENSSKTVTDRPLKIS